jgi:hypothetical protein
MVWAMTPMMPRTANRARSAGVGAIHTMSPGTARINAGPRFWKSTMWASESRVARWRSMTMLSE